jgi:hypothetical protein
LPPESTDRFALDGELRRFILEWSTANGWSAVQPGELCTEAMAGAALDPGTLLAGHSGEWSALENLALSPVALRADYRLNLVPGSVLTRTTVLTGTVTYDPSQIEYYKVELGQGREPDTWITLGSTHLGPVVDGPLETLDAPSLPAGEYIVRLVLVKNDGNFLLPPHSVPVRIGR